MFKNLTHGFKTGFIKDFSLLSSRTSLFVTEPINSWSSLIMYWCLVVVSPNKTERFQKSRIMLHNSSRVLVCCLYNIVNCLAKTRECAWFISLWLDGGEHVHACFLILTCIWIQGHFTCSLRFGLFTVHGCSGKWCAMWAALHSIVLSMSLFLHWLPSPLIDTR